MYIGLRFRLLICTIATFLIARLDLWDVHAGTDAEIEICVRAGGAFLKTAEQLCYIVAGKFSNSADVKINIENCSKKARPVPIEPSKRLSKRG